MPFIWSYRKDYIHPEMKSSHLWFIMEQDVKWEAMHSLRYRGNLELQALIDAAQGDANDVSVHPPLIQSLSPPRLLYMHADEHSQRRHHREKRPGG